MRQIIFIFLFMISFGITHGGLPYGAEPDQFLVHVNILNQEDREQRDVTLRAYSYEGGVSLSEKFDVDDDASAASLIFVQKPVVEPDYYPIRVSVLDEDGKRTVKHVWTFLE